MKPKTLVTEVSRRRFLVGGMAISGSLFAGVAGAYAKDYVAKVPGAIDFASLQKSIKGQVSVPADAQFQKIATDGLWNRLIPNRLPQLIVKVENEQDVVEAVKFAKANKLKVVVRGGGHNWCAPSLRNGGMMIDLTNLNKVISVDPVARKAVMQPIISNREVQAALKPHGMAFPSGHCPQVKISGYLLSGGMAWNQGVWGPGVGSVEAIEMVTPDGELITASKDQNQDYYWAARGAGCGFFGVAVRYHLKLYPLPKVITASSYSYPLDQVGTVAEWLGNTASKLPSNVELSIFLVTPGADQAKKLSTGTDKICLVTATVFAESEAEAKQAIKLLDECPVKDKCLDKTVSEVVDFERLFDMSGALWPENRRNHVEAMFSNSKPAELFNAVKDHFQKAPSTEGLIMFAFFTGPNVPAPVLTDASFSMSAHLYGGPWTMWKDASEDEANSKWHKKCLELLKPFVAGHYISESDTVQYPEHIKGAFLPQNFRRLEELRKKYDPDGVFFAFSDGLN